MDEYTADAFANRDDPLPVLTISTEPDGGTGEEADSSRSKGKRPLSASRLKEKIQDVGAAHAEKLDGHPSLQDRIFSRLLQQVIPTEDAGETREEVVDRRSSRYVKRPAFSLPLMTNNFRRFNARIGIVFVFQNRLIRLFNWTTPSHTLCFLAVYTFVCLDPNLLIVLPLATILLFIMVPAFLARHPPPPPSASTSGTAPYYSYHGPALAPARTIKPASETSKDFFRNMRDLQNSMADFSAIHDTLVALIAPLTNFSNETLSSALFLWLSVAAALCFITSQLLPWRFIFLVFGYMATVTGHPSIQIMLAQFHEQAKQKAEQQGSHSRYYIKFLGTSIPSSLSAWSSLLSSLSSISLDSAPEEREVEIFELQHRPMSLFASAANAEWQPLLFSPTPYDPLSPSRISGDRPHGTRFFEDVRPPKGWQWKGKKWELDLDCREWVTERLVTGVEFELSAPESSTEAEAGGWVWDLPPRARSPFDEDEDILLYGSESEAKRQKKKQAKSVKGKSKEKPKPQQDWEEGHLGTTGEWRRRRWVRLVSRVGEAGGSRDDPTKGP